MIGTDARRQHGTGSRGAWAWLLLPAALEGPRSRRARGALLLLAAMLAGCGVEGGKPAPGRGGGKGPASATSGVVPASATNAAGPASTTSGAGPASVTGAAAPGPATASTGPASATPASAPALCEHKVPADLCTRCSPELAAVFRASGDWCNEHGVPESLCLQCNPGLRFDRPAAPADWCNEHGVPESSCTKCKPSLVAKFIEAGDFCREHGLPQSLCPRCNPALLAGKPAKRFPEPGTLVTLASARTEQAAGIETVTVTRRRFSRTLDVVGTLGFDQNRLAQLSARGDGVVVEVKVDLGDEVRAGQPLVVVTSATVGADRAQLQAARARLRTAEAALSREKSLLASGISSRQEVERAEQELGAARAEVDGASASLGAAGAGEGAAGGRHVLTAPFAGTVVARDAVAGRTVAPGQTLVEVADLKTIWAQLDLPEEDAGAVRPGQRVTIRLEAAQGEIREGLVARVASSLDRETRTVRARVELANPDRSLKAGSFVRAQVHVAEDREALLVPREAIQRAEETALVFVRTRPGVFEPVPVVLGPGTRTEVEIVSGLTAGAEVVTTGAFLLKTEILKGSIGAGCCDLEPKKKKD